MSMGGGSVFKVKGHKCTSKKLWKFMWFALATVTSQEFECGLELGGLGPCGPPGSATYVNECDAIEPAILGSY